MAASSGRQATRADENSHRGWSGFHRRMVREGERAVSDAVDFVGTYDASFNLEYSR
jgi:hypothetical protein